MRRGKHRSRGGEDRTPGIQPYPVLLGIEVDWLKSKYPSSQTRIALTKPQYGRLRVGDMLVFGFVPGNLTASCLCFTRMIWAEIGLEWFVVFGRRGRRMLWDALLCLCGDMQGIPLQAVGTKRSEKRRSRLNFCNIHVTVGLTDESKLL